jgi:hypothetical protein
MIIIVVLHKKDWFRLRVRIAVLFLKVDSDEAIFLKTAKFSTSEGNRGASGEIANYVSRASTARRKGGVDRRTMMYGTGFGP